MPKACSPPRSDFEQSTPHPLTGPRFHALLISLLGAGKPVRFPAYGYSMTPTIQHGDTVTLVPVSQRKPVCGDIVAVMDDQRGGRRIIVHRLARQAEGTVETRGDALSWSDGWFADTAVVGVVTRVERHGREVWWPRTAWAYRLVALWRRVRSRAGRCRSLGRRAWALVRGR